VDLLLRLLYKQ